MSEGINGMVFDAGALIALERRNEDIRTLLRTVRRSNLPVVIPANVVAQAWRNGARQALLAKFLAEPWVRIVPVDEELAKAAGVLLARTGTTDAVDASVVVTAVKLGLRRIVTSDPEDIAILAPTLDIIAI